MKRLYIGGLSHSVTQKDLKDRFGKFGDVEDVEVRTRRDDDGVPYKTFSYININISDADLKKCMTVLNKSKWKGGTLQIETAKESFLNRLAEERQTAEEQRLQQPEVEDERQKMLDSLSKAGVDNFTMKAAVPGTEVPGHKDWVVSKFGRVLPVLQLKCQKGSRARTVNYDPSKYSHNIRKLDRSTVEQHTPVTQLTWEEQGGDDDISKKRRGEFPPYEPPRRKKSRKDVVKSHNAEGGAGSPPRRSLLRVKTVVSVDHTEARRFTNGDQPPTNHRLAQRRTPRSTDWDIDSDEEIHKMVTAQDTSHAALQQQQQEEEEEDDQLEVVGLDYLVKSGWKGGPDHKDENDYDSGDTDELFASRKPPLPPPQQRSTPQAPAQLSGNDRKRKMKKKKSTAGEEEDDSSGAEEEVASRKPSGEHSSQNQSKKMKVLPVVSLPSSESDEEDEDEEELESADCSSDSDYEAMFSNVTRLEISLADLQKLAGESSGQETNLTAGSSERPAPKKGTTPEEILAAIMEDSSDDEQQQKKKKKKTKAVKVSTPLPAFQGTRALTKDAVKAAPPSTPHSESSSSEEEERENAPPAPHSESSSEEEEEQSEEEVEEEKQTPVRVPLGAKEEEERQRKTNMRRLAAVQQRQKEAEDHKKLIQGALSNLDAPKAGAGKHIVFGSDEDDDEDDDEDEQQTTSEVTTPKKTLSQDGQSEDDAAVSEKERTKGKVRVKPSVPQLFGGSEDEEDGDEEEDGSRFDVRPQFEGRVGQKLMALQSRFGTDERFRMDSRFLDEEEEEEEEEKSEKKKSVTEEEEALEEERKKNLSILQSVLGSSQQTHSSKTAVKAKAFRDVSALHYDPSREEHAAFETKTDETKKESKAARRKKREEAQKLPEVSKEIYYDVSGDLKAVFGQTKDEDVAGGGDEETNWDREEEAKEEEDGGGKEEQPTLQSSLLSADPGAENEEASGFKFSFFEDDTETGSGETAEYKVESIQAPKVSWQQDLRFQDSSSEEEEEEEQQQEEEEEQSNVTAKTTEEETPSKTDLFFFYLGDSRLTEGPRLFCRPSQLEEQREQWEERRSELRQEYRKKHKDARRKLRSSLKS
ncbi:nucleolar protein 8 isoform X2 [Anarrhichthys ocellatus]|uniref:nucleolar protein 8 isoform X2 n=1 Tax=Anarrhichthys ocellatus TaxID=433405 RepID=UPI0012EE8638|nr:nucleolar protein 8 isoform X2 [Anarrhichthys ocellatus]